MQSAFLSSNINQHLFIIGDPQFGAVRVFEHVPQRKSYGDLETFHETLVDNWNSVVGADDFVLCLGDFTQNLKDKQESMSLVEKYTQQLNGKKILIRGNHDAEDTPWYYDSGWNCLVEYPLLVDDGSVEWFSAPTPFAGCIISEINGLRILFSHFAIHEDEYCDSRYLVEKAYLRELFDEYDCDYNVHGHTHTRPVNHPHCLSACAERVDFTPIRVGEFLANHAHLASPHPEHRVRSLQLV